MNSAAAPEKRSARGGAARHGPMRLDRLLVERGFFETRSRARDAIERGTVSVDGRTAGKSGAMVDADAPVTLDDPARGYVSRAALKLIAGLDRFGLDPAGRSALDVGASTGGFTQVLLERAAAHVTAVDVGQGQLHPSLRDDPRVTALDRVNARTLTAANLAGRPVECLVADVSFISLKTALAPALSLAAPGAWTVLLVKPQFEAGRAAIGKGGILRDPARGAGIAEDLSRWLSGRPGWKSLGVIESPISGGDGNGEFLLGGRRP